MAALERPERLQIMLSAEELQALEDFRFENRMPSRAAAVRELMRRGLASGGFLKAGSGARSQDFGVIDKTADAGDASRRGSSGSPQGKPSSNGGSNRSSNGSNDSHEGG
nr:hypothetical protein [Chelativorans sp.]